MDPRGTEATAGPAAEPREEARIVPAAARAWSEWLQQLTRAAKTSRLYDPANPAVATLRRDLTTALEAVLTEHGAIEMTFTPESIAVGETPLYVARSREDNLALPFFRDGIRSMSLQPGMDAREVGALLDAILTATQRGGEDVDLVTLLWESELDHVSIRYVSTEGDLETGGESAAETAATVAGPIAPWPKAGAAAASSGEPAVIESDLVDDTGRSDDRITSGRAREIERALVALEIAADAEVTRFRKDLEAESARPLARSVLDLMSACFRHTTREDDRDELRRFVPRLLHDAVAHGDWAEARECLYLLRNPGRESSGIAEFQRDIERPDSSTSRGAWRTLERQTPEEHELFFEFARELGPDATDWLMQGVAESQRQAVRRGLVRTLAAMLHGAPERLAPWLADDRWYVVRNAVHTLTLMDAPPPVGLLRGAAKHHDPRVRREVVTALQRVKREDARPLLLDMLGHAESRLFAAVLQQLATGPDSEIAGRMLEAMAEESFRERPEEERRAIVQAIAVTGGESALSLLEGHLNHGNWFQRGNETLRSAAALCLARIGTAGAREILERGAASRRGEVARACRAALATVRPSPGDTR